MLNQDRIAIGKLKQAYGLDAQEADILIAELAKRKCLYLYDSWQEAENFFAAQENPQNESGPAREELYFPELLDLQRDLLRERIATKRILKFFMVRARGSTPRECLQKRFDRVLHFTYDATYNVVDKPHGDLVNQILDLIYEQRVSAFLGPPKNRVDIFVGYVSRELFTKFCRFFDDAITVDKASAVRYLSEFGYPLKQEVKGISRKLVESLTAVTTQHLTAQSSALMDQNALIQKDNVSSVDMPSKPEPSPITVPAKLWQGKTPPAVRDAMRHEGYDDSVIAYVLFNWCKLKNKTQIGKLLGGDPDQNDSTHLRRANSLLGKSKALTISPA